jgi:hypothetical protein
LRIDIHVVPSCIYPKVNEVIFSPLWSVIIHPVVPIAICGNPDTPTVGVTPGLVISLEPDVNDAVVAVIGWWAPE